MWSLALAQHTAGVAQVGHLHGDAETVVVAAMVADEGQVRAGKSPQANEFALVVGKREELHAFDRRQHLASRHRNPLPTG